MDLVYFEYDCYGEIVKVKNPKYYDNKGELMTLDSLKQNSLYTGGNILDSYLVLGRNGVGKTTMFNNLSKIRFFKNRASQIKQLELFDYNTNKFCGGEQCIDVLDDISTILIKKDFDKEKYTIEITNDDTMGIEMSDEILFNYIIENKDLLNIQDDREFCLGILKDDFDNRNTEINKIFDLLKLNTKMKILFLVCWGLYENKLNLESTTYNSAYSSELDYYYFEEKIIYKYPNSGIKRILDNVLDFSKEQIENEEIIESMYLILTDKPFAYDNHFINKEEISTSYVNILKQFVALLEQYDDVFYLKNNDVGNIYFKLPLSTDIFGLIKKLLHLKIRDTYIFKFKPDISSGERALAEITSCINVGIRKLKETLCTKNVCFLLLDEIEQNLHPEWCRKLYTWIIEEINKVELPYKFYIYMSTHSPYVISDFTSDHIINLDDECYSDDFQTFGANIHDILSKGMFLDNPMGEYALSMIRRVHEALTSNKSKEDIIKECGMDEKKLRYFIDSIGEPLIKMQLRSLYEKLFETGKNKIKISRNELKNVKTEEQLIQLLNNCNIEVE